MNKTIKSLAISTIGSIATVAVSAGVSAVQERRNTERRGYLKVGFSTIVSRGIRTGEYAISGNEIAVGVLEKDRKGDVATICIHALGHVRYESELPSGFYLTNIDGVYLQYFYDNMLGEFIRINEPSVQYKIVDLGHIKMDEINKRLDDLTKVAVDVSRKLNEKPAATKKSKSKAKPEAATGKSNWGEL